MGRFRRQLSAYTSDREREPQELPEYSDYTSEQEQEQDQGTKRPETQGKGWLDSPWAKISGITIITIGVLWASSFLFSALGASVKSFKKMSRSFKE